MVRLIRSIAFGTQETKHHEVTYNTFAAAGSAPPNGGGVPNLTSASYAYVRHLWGDLPSAIGVNSSTDYSYIGDEVYIKGVKTRWFLQTFVGATIGRLHCRMSICATSAWEDTGSDAVNAVPMPVSWYLDPTLPHPYRRFNSQKIQVLWSKSWNTIDDPQMTQLRSHYHKFGRKFKRANEQEPTALDTRWGINAHKDYFVLLEAYKMDNTDLDTGLTSLFEKSVYFKDG